MSQLNANKKIAILSSEKQIITFVRTTKNNNPYFIVKSKVQIIFIEKRRMK